MHITDNDNRFQYLEIDDEPAPAAQTVLVSPQPLKTVEQVIAERKAAEAAQKPASEQYQAPAVAQGSGTTTLGAGRSARLEARDRYLQGNGIPIHSFSTDETVRHYEPQLRALLARTTDKDMRAEVESILRRVPANRAGQADIDASQPLTSGAPVGQLDLAAMAANPGQLQTMPVYVDAQVKNTVTESTIVAVEEATDSTSAITYFSAHKGVDLTKLAAAWESEGLPESDLLTPPSKRQALTRALKTLIDDGIRIDDHPKGGSAVVVRSTVNQKLVFTTAARVFLDQTGALVVEREDADEETHAALVQVLSAEYAAQQRTVTGGDVGGWLVDLVAGRRGLQGTALRSTGGIYFVPPKSVPTLEKIKRACAVVGVTVHAIPAVRTKATIEAVLEAIARASTELLASVKEQLTEERGKRWVASRLAELAELEEQLVTYERFLGMRLDGTRAEIKATRALLDAHATRGNLLEVE